MRKLFLIGLVATLVGCGTSNKVLANDIFTQGGQIDYTKLFNERTALIVYCIS